MSGLVVAGPAVTPAQAGPSRPNINPEYWNPSAAPSPRSQINGDTRLISGISPHGSWEVIPQGVREAYGGLTGAGSTSDTTGAKMLVHVKLDPFDDLRLYAGQPATGQKDIRDGGSGYMNGGTGGKSVKCRVS